MAGLSDKEKFIVLVDNETLKKSNAIVLLEGDSIYRVPWTCELFHAGWAEQIIFSGGSKVYEYGSFPFEKVKDYIEQHNVQADSIIVDDISLHTREQAQVVIKMCIEKNWTRILLVGSHYHQYRAFLTFLQVLIEYNVDRQIEIINAPASQLDWFELLPYGRRFELLDMEFEKIEEYGAKGHVAGYAEAIKYFKWKASL